MGDESESGQVGQERERRMVGSKGGEGHKEGWQGEAMETGEEKGSSLV